MCWSREYTASGSAPAIKTTSIHGRFCMGRDARGRIVIMRTCSHVSACAYPVPVHELGRCMSNRTIPLTDTLHQYLLDVSLREPDLQRRLREETATHPMA